MNPSIRQDQAQTETAAKFAAVLAVLFTVANLIPQTGYFGRGARTIFVLFALWYGVAFVAGGMGAMVYRQRAYIIFALLFMGTVLVTYRWRSNTPQVVLQMVTGLTRLYMVFTVAAYHAQSNPARWRRMREWVILLTAVAILPSLGLLYDNPKIARSLGELGTPDDTGLVDGAIAGLGVGTYSLYSQLGVVLPCWLTLAVSVGGQRRLLLIAAAGVVSLAVAMSTFTAAVVLLLVGLVVTLLSIPFLRGDRYRWLYLALSISLIVALSGAMLFLNRQSESFEFATDKAARIFAGITASGLAEGDETGRGAMFFSTLATFMHNPVFGVGYQANTDLVGGHSTWIDPWAQYGIVGYLPFFLFQALLTRRVVNNWRRQPRNVVAWGSLLCWMLFWAAGFLNPTLFSVLPGVLLFSDCYVNNASADPSGVTRMLIHRTNKFALRRGVTKMPTTIR